MCYTTCLIFSTHIFQYLEKEERSAGSCHHIFTLPTLTPLQVSVGDIPKVWISDISDVLTLDSALHIKILKLDTQPR